MTPAGDPSHRPYATRAVGSPGGLVGVGMFQVSREKPGKSPKFSRIFSLVIGDLPGFCVIFFLICAE